MACSYGKSFKNINMFSKYYSLYFLNNIMVYILMVDGPDGLAV